MPTPAPPFEHLLRLTDDTGLMEHARGAVGRRQHAYCVDDAARGLVVISREPDPSPALTRAGECYLGLLAHAQTPDGASHNRLSFERRFEDQPDLGDSWGRALWGFGTAAARHRDPWLRAGALDCFEQGAAARSISSRAMAYAALGAADVLTVRPGHAPALALLQAAADRIEPAASRQSSSWPWPEPRLAYANALLPEALIAAGAGLADEAMTLRGLELLGWLLDLETRGSRLSLTPVGGWSPGDPRPAFDQQPIEASALAEACARASAVSADPRWPTGVRLAAGWFLGDNDLGVAMHDPATGGGYDGLTPGGPNTNQGAESTLALIATLQLAHRLVPSLV